MLPPHPLEASSSDGSARGIIVGVRGRARVAAASQRLGTAWFSTCSLGASAHSVNSVLSQWARAEAEVVRGGGWWRAVRAGIAASARRASTAKAEATTYVEPCSRAPRACLQQRAKHARPHAGAPHLSRGGSQFGVLVEFMGLLRICF